MIEKITPSDWLDRHPNHQGAAATTLSCGTNGPRRAVWIDESNDDAFFRTVRRNFSGLEANDAREHERAGRTRVRCPRSETCCSSTPVRLEHEEPLA